MNLQSIDASAASPEVVENENFETLDALAVYGKRQPTTTGLVWGYTAGRWGGFAVAAGTVTLTDNTTNYLVAHRADGAVSVSTSATNWNDTSNYARVYKLTTVSGAVTAVEDHRAGLNGVHGPSTGAVLAYLDSAALFTSVALTGTRNGSNLVFTCTKYPQLVQRNGIPQTTLSDGTGNTADIAITGTGPYTVTFAAAPSSTDSLIALTV